MRARLGCGFMLLLVCGVAADEKKDEKIDPKLLVGKWRQVEPKDGPQVTIEFTAAGKVLCTAEVEGQTLKFSGTYKVTGNKLVTRTKMEDGDEEVESGSTITKLTKDLFEATDQLGIDFKGKRLPNK